MSSLDTSLRIISVRDESICLPLIIYPLSNSLDKFLTHLLQFHCPTCFPVYYLYSSSSVNLVQLLQFWIILSRNIDTTVLQLQNTLANASLFCIAQMKSNSREKGQLPEYLKNDCKKREREWWKRRLKYNGSHFTWIFLCCCSTYTNNMQSFAVNVLRLVVAAKVSLRPERELTMSFFCHCCKFSFGHVQSDETLLCPKCI